MVKRKERKMSVNDEKILIHFNTSDINIYILKNDVLNILRKERAFFESDSTSEMLLEEIDRILDELGKYVGKINNERIRLYATGLFQNLTQSDQTKLIIHCFVDYGLYFNIIPSELERFYLEKSMSINGEKDIMKGLIFQEFRSVVICGSFENSLKYIDDIITVLKKRNITVLSPQSTKVKPETIGSNFILFDYQDGLKNERDTWRHKYEHMGKFKQSDAIIICNPNGIIGSEGTIFELGFMVAYSKRIIFTEKPKELSVIFPYEIGLNFT